MSKYTSSLWSIPYSWNWVEALGQQRHFLFIVGKLHIRGKEQYNHLAPKLPAKSNAGNMPRGASAFSY